MLRVVRRLVSRSVERWIRDLRGVRKPYTSESNYIWDESDVRAVPLEDTLRTAVVFNMKRGCTFKGLAKCLSISEEHLRVLIREIWR